MKEKCVVSEICIRNLKNKTYKFMNSVSNNAYIEKIR